MSDYDDIDIAGGDMQCPREGGSYPASTTHPLDNVVEWTASTDCTYSYDNGDFQVPINIQAGVPKRPPKDATTLTLSPATAIAYMRKKQGS